MRRRQKFSGCDRELVSDSDRWPCAICRKGVGRNSIFCSSCSQWVHKRCGCLKGTLMHSADYKFAASRIDCIRSDTLEVVDKLLC